MLQKMAKSLIFKSPKINNTIPNTTEKKKRIVYKKEKCKFNIIKSAQFNIWEVKTNLHRGHFFT